MKTKRRSTANKTTTANVMRILQYLHDSTLTTEETNIAHVSGALGIPPGTFKQPFLHRTGKHYSHYIQEQRLQRAKRLLLHTRDTVDKIAKKCGFTDGNRLGYLLLKATGKTTTEYRNAYATRPPKENPYVVKILNYLNNASLETDPLQAKDVAKILTIPVFRFERDFQAVVGQYYSEYVAHLKIEEAKALLTETSVLIPTIAKKCGYTTAPALSKAFKRITALTPKTYRNRHRPKWQVQTFQTCLEKGYSIESAMHIAGVNNLEAMNRLCITHTGCGISTYHSLQHLTAA